MILPLTGNVIVALYLSQWHQIFYYYEISVESITSCIKLALSKTKQQLKTLKNLVCVQLPECTRSQMHTIRNEHDTEWIQFWMDIIPNRRDPEWIQSLIVAIPNGHNPWWTRSRMDTIPNGHDPEWTQAWMGNYIYILLRKCLNTYAW